MSDARTDGTDGTVDDDGGDWPVATDAPRSPLPPRPPAPLHDDAMPDDPGSSDGGPATSACRRSAPTTVRPARPAWPSAAGVAHAAAGPVAAARRKPRPRRRSGSSMGTGYTTAVPPAPALVPAADRRVGRDRRPQVTVRGPRRAKLVIRRVDPWSVLKFSFLFSICLLIVWVVDGQRAALAAALDARLRQHQLGAGLRDVVGDATQKGFQINPTRPRRTAVGGDHRRGQRVAVHCAGHPGCVPLQPDLDAGRRRRGDPRPSATERPLG